jgi:hypothetical protein
MPERPRHYDQHQLEGKNLPLIGENAHTRFREIEDSLRKGNTLYADTSGSALRIVTVERQGKILGSGQQPTIEEALREANEDLWLKANPGNDTYAIEYPRYLRGSSESPSQLDNLMFNRSYSFKAKQDDEGKIVVKMKGYKSDEDMPDEVLEKLTKDKESVEYEDMRGVVFRADHDSADGGRFYPDAIEVPEGANPDTRHYTHYSYKVSRSGRGDTLQEAIIDALNSPLTPAEEKDK